MTSLSQARIAVIVLGMALVAFAAACGEGDAPGASGGETADPATSDANEPGRLVLLVSIDTLRRDHLGCYGYGRRTTPRIDAFAASRGILFDRAYAQAPYTLPSHMSLLTGLYPHGHDVRLPVQGEGRPTLDARVSTLAETFAAAGYRTAAFTDGGLMDAEFGFGRGFEVYDDDRVESHLDNGFERFERNLHDWILEHRDEDQFVFVHTFDVHGPYEAPESFAGMFRGTEAGRALPDASLFVPSLLHSHAYLDLRGYEDVSAVVDAYDACIRFVDDRVGALLDVVDRAGLLDEAVIAIVSDHGEDFLEDGLTIGHTRFLSEPVLRVPWILKLPEDRGAGARTDALVELVDVFPTLLAAAGVEIGEGPLDGESVLPLLEPRGSSSADEPSRFAFATGPFGGDQHVLVRDGVKYRSAIERPLGEFAQDQLAARAPRGWENHRGGYDFKTDLYGLLEIVPCENRLTSTTGGASPPGIDSGVEVDDPALLASLRDEALAIAEQGRSLGFSSTAGRDLSASAKRQLEALGYVAGLEPAAGTSNASAPSRDARAGATDGPGPGSTAGGEEGGKEGGKEGGGPDLDCADLPRRGPVDRSDLHRGDAVLWRLNRARRGRASWPSVAEAESLAAEARAAWKAFAARHPERRSWTQWRIDQLARELEGLPRDDSGAPDSNTEADSGGRR